MRISIDAAGVADRNISGNLLRFSGAFERQVCHMLCTHGATDRQPLNGF